MDVSIVGSGYVGTTIAACLAEMGHSVTCIEVDEAVVESINDGSSPIHEPGVEERLQRYAGDTLVATDSYDAVTDTAVTLLCLPTPQTDDGELDVSIMESGAASLGRALASTDDDHVVVVKSTVLPGSTEDVIGPRIERASGRSIGDGIDLVMNPEFLRMGSAVDDFRHPDKIVIGSQSDRATARLEELYEPIIEREDTHLVRTGIREAELIKYANNAFLAGKLSLVNELGNIAKEYDCDAYEVLAAVGLDDRISARFMRSGLGWGGSCFPKDVNALRAGARSNGYDPELLDAVVAVNEGQPDRLVELLDNHVDTDGARIAVLGLSFKPGTDDVRESRSLDVIARLLERNADVVAYDPVANGQVEPIFPHIDYADSAEEAVDGADGAVIATGWPEFSEVSFDGMTQRILIDGRRVEVDRDSLDVYDGLTW